MTSITDVPQREKAFVPAKKLNSDYPVRHLHPYSISVSTSAYTTTLGSACYSPPMSESLTDVHDSSSTVTRKPIYISRPRPATV